MSTIDSITYQSAKAVTASDTVNDTAGPFAGIYTGAGGTIKVTTIEGDTATLVSCPAGVIVPLAILRVWSSTTTATSVLGMVSRPYKGVP